MTEIEYRTPRHLQDYVDRLNHGKQFTLSNIGGDGEFLTITGWGGTNSDGRESTPGKALALGQTLLKPRIEFHGYNPGHLDSDKRRNAEAWLRKQGINCPEYIPGHGLQDHEFGLSDINVRWVHKELISSANAGGRLNPFLRALRERTLLVVGPTTITHEFLDDVLQAKASVLVKPEDGWEILDDIEGDVDRTLRTLPNDTVVLWSLGYLTKVIMWRLAILFPAVTQIDVGAIWDPYCGLLNRHGYRRPEWALTHKAANLEGLT